MLIIPYSIYKKELQKVEKWFSLSDIVLMAKKVKKGLGTQLKNKDGSKIVKIYSTQKGVAGRCLFLLVSRSGNVVPLLMRTKKDPIGENMTFKNKAFSNVFSKNYELVQKDLLSGNFDVIEL